MTRAFLVAFGFALCARGLAAQRPDSIVIDQKRDSALVGRKYFGRGSRIPLVSSHVRVKLGNTNTAVYQCSETHDSIANPQLADLQLFLKALGPYALLRNEEVPDELAPLQEVLDELTDATEGESGLLPARSAAWETLSRMERGESVEALARQLGKDLAKRNTCSDSLCTRVNPADRTITLLSSLARLLRAVPASHARDTIVQRARDAVTQESKAIAFALGTAVFLRDVVRDTSDTTCIDLEVPWDAGRHLTVNVRAKDLAEVSAFAERPPVTYEFEVQPRWPGGFTLGLNLALVYAPGQKFDHIEVQTVNDSTRAVNTGTDNRTRSYALVLSSHFDCLPARTTLDLLVNPKDDIRALGAGFGHDEGALHVGLGWISNRHGVASADSSRVDQVWSRASGFYLTVAVHGWEPFKPARE